MPKWSAPQPTGRPPSSICCNIRRQDWWSPNMLIFGTEAPQYLRSLKTQTVGGANKTRSPFQIRSPVCVWSASLKQTEPVQSRLERAYASIFLINIKSSSPGGPDEKTPRVSLGLLFRARHPQNILTLEKQQQQKKSKCCVWSSRLKL